MPHALCPPSPSHSLTLCSRLWGDSVSGVPPFFGDEQSMCDAILAASYSFPPQHFAAASAAVKDFIASMLIRNPALRPTALQALTHPWLTQDADLLRTELALSGSLEQYLQGLRETRG